MTRRRARLCTCRRHRSRCDLCVDLDGCTATAGGRDLQLSPRQVHWVCWGDTTPSRRVDVQLCRLRAKTGRDLFRNVRDRGWALRAAA